mmetsp:Transcript_7845/g.19934  ORF Transcript_7845/g.19934 Transcript_7845/m.19934 type:complete len:408 (-) Transcript_7845:15-1238(-)
MRNTRPPNTPCCSTHGADLNGIVIVLRFSGFAAFSPAGLTPCFFVLGSSPNPAAAAFVPDAAPAAAAAAAAAGAASGTKAAAAGFGDEPKTKKQGVKPAGEKAANPEKRRTITMPFRSAPCVEQHGVLGGRVFLIDVEIKGQYAGTWVIDTVSATSMVRSEICEQFRHKDYGVPHWAVGQEGSEYTTRLVGFPNAWLGSIHLDELRVTSSVGAGAALPPGCSGTLGRDFFSLFDWDFDFTKMMVTVSVASKGGPLPFDVVGMRPLPLSIRVIPLVGQSVPTCQVDVRLPGAAECTSCEAVLDLMMPCVVCNPAMARAVGALPKGRAVAEVVCGGGGDREIFPLRELTFGLGSGGPVSRTTSAALGESEVFAACGFDSETPAVIVGADLIGQGRMVMSLRKKCLWLSV